MHSRSLRLFLPCLLVALPCQLGNLTVLSNPCWYVSILVLLSWGAFFFYVSGVVTNARSAHTIGASVEELTCSKNQRRDWRCLIGINGDVLYFHQCMLGNVNTPESSVEHAFYDTTGWGSWGSATAPEAKHTSWKKSLSCLDLESFWWSEHCISNRARHAFSLPLDCCDWLTAWIGIK